MRAYEYRHVVTFEDTNLLGNVYYVNLIRWQGRCRELFLREHAPNLLSEIKNGLTIVTVRCACDYFAELASFDEVVIRMRLKEIMQNRITMTFDYTRNNEEVIIAKGEQQIVFMRREGNVLVATPIPETLRDALKTYI